MCDGLQALLIQSGSQPVYILFINFKNVAVVFRSIFTVNLQPYSLQEIYKKPLIFMRIMRIIFCWERIILRAREIEKILLRDGWYVKNQKGSHRQYIHPVKPGKITIPIHNGDLDIKTATSILRQAGLK